MSSKNVSQEEIDLLNIFNSSSLSLDDINWLKNKRWFKKYLKKYAKELKKIKNIEKKDTEISNNLNNSTEILEFTQKISIPKNEIIEILDFTKTIDLTSVKNINEIREKTKSKLQKERNFYYIVIIVCFILIIFLILFLINNNAENKDNIKMSNDIFDVSNVKEEKINKNKLLENTSNLKIEDLYEKYGNINLIGINFKNLIETNSDVRGWLKVKGTNVNYPFVQTEDNEYYLKHSFDKTYNKKGWVFLDYRNKIDSLDKNTILYAHGLVNNQMFGSLRNIFDDEWFSKKDNRIIQTATLNSVQLWEIFSTYRIEPESYYITTNFKDDEEYLLFLETIKSRSERNYDISIDVDDKVLTLSSCYDNEKRMVIHAKLLVNQKK